ncbi:MAG: hypothetical protein AABY64_06940 [Bdellovibrionota bacterium]
MLPILQKLKFKVIDLRETGKGVFITANLDQSVVAAYKSTSSCGFLCFDSVGSAKNTQVENGIEAGASGRENKIGTSIGYYFNEQHGAFASYNRFDAKLSMYANRLTAPEANINSSENVGAVSTGLGYFYHLEKTDVLLAITMNNVNMEWRDEKLSGAVLGIHYTASF